MNEKQEFLNRLREALLERDVSVSDIAPYIERFDRFYDRMRDDPAGNHDILSDVERIADNIADQIAERYESINQLAEQTMSTPRSDAAVVPTESTEASDQADSVLEGDVPAEDEAPPEGEDESIVFAPSEAQVDSTEADESAIDPDSPPTAQYNSALIERTMKPSESEETPPDEYIDEEEAPTGTLFWVLFAVSLPILIPLAAAGCALFLAVWLALAVLSIASIALLVVGAGAGCAISLVGIIYGITQLFVTLPVGLYELGLGIIIGGVVMFAGIILYNFAIRLVPLLMRLVGKLFRYTCGRIKRLFIFLRRECAKL